MRFPEFIEEWETKKLGEIAKIGDGLHGTPIYVHESDFYFINGNNLVNGQIQLNDNTKKISKETYIKSDKELKENTLLISINGTIGNIAKYNSEKVMLGKSVGYFNFNNKSDFFYYALQTRSVQDFFSSELTGSTIKNLSLKTLRETFVPLPSQNEQQKIASFLSCIDERIKTQNKIIRELNVLKTNAAKSIFIQDLRFKDDSGNDYPNWKEKKLKDLFTFKITNSFSREKLNYENGKVKNIHYGDIHTKFQTLFDIVKEEVPYVNSNIDIDKINEDNYCKVGDVIFADASEDLKDVGKSIEIINLNNQKILAGLHTLLARPTVNTFSIGFCGHLFTSDIVRMQIQKESQGSKVLSISAIRLSNISLSVPNLEEQTKIVNFLSSIDSKIDIENKLLQKLEEQKKFLLHQMFV